MRTAKRKQMRYIIVARHGSLIASMTSEGLRMLAMEIDVKPHFFFNREQALTAISRNMIRYDLEIIETAEW